MNQKSIASILLILASIPHFAKADDLRIIDMKCVTTPSNKVETAQELEPEKRRNRKNNTSIEISRFYSYYNVRGLLMGEEKCPATVIDKYNRTAVLNGEAGPKGNDNDITHCIYEMLHPYFRYHIVPAEQGSPKLTQTQRYKEDELLSCTLPN